MRENQIVVSWQNRTSPNLEFCENNYNILLFRGNASFYIDGSYYTTVDNVALFLTPYQRLRWVLLPDSLILKISFHGDFYCIEYHKDEVACNGLLFNNIYSEPFVTINNELSAEIEHIAKKMGDYMCKNCYSDAILKTYLQLILALCSNEKGLENNNELVVDKEKLYFRELLETHFVNQREVSFYADKYALSTNAFSKKIKRSFGKTPIQLISERVTLEAKKRLHLTYKPVKEIAAELKFDDEYYFSRYFKKTVGLSPSSYREKVGISIVAQLSIR